MTTWKQHMDYFYKMNPGNKTCPSDFKYWLQDIATDSFMFRNSLSLFKKLFNHEDKLIYKQNPHNS